MSELRDSGQRDGTGLSARRFRVVAEWPSVESDSATQAIIDAQEDEPHSWVAEELEPDATSNAALIQYPPTEEKGDTE